MAGVTCPQCGQLMAYVAELSGANVSCPRCHAAFAMPVAAVEPPPIIRRFTKAEKRQDPAKRYARTAMMVGALGGVAGVPLGAVLSQFMPLYGGFLTLGQPFSPARMQLLLGHCVLVGVLGAVFGAIAGFAKELFSDL